MTIAHGLNDTLDFVITKSRTQGENWAIWHKGLASKDELLRFTGDAALSSANYWQTDNEWTDSTFGVLGTANLGDNNYGDMVARNATLAEMRAQCCVPDDLVPCSVRALKEPACVGEAYLLRLPVEQVCGTETDR